MRDMKPCQHTLSDDIVYKEVVVIGNGPSGMVTSFMLAGNVPYLKHIPDDLPIDDMLKARLQNLPPGVSLLETELTSLAEGLEGRSQNPIPLLVGTHTLTSQCYRIMTYVCIIFQEPLAQLLRHGSLLL
nr:oxidative stress-induced growth inhibitor 1-like [Danaus plexippus plexippus]XP_032523982.1 oxidative stress-induced growth inhibitor 1-like [Danaus plexippus plexippus]